MGVVLSGEPLRVDGLVLETGRRVPPSIAPDARWVEFRNPFVREDGSWLLAATYQVTGGAEESVLLRDGAVVLRTGDPVEGELVGEIHFGLMNDADDLAVVAMLGWDRKLLLNGAVLIESQVGLDVDGDGRADPPFQTGTLSRHASQYQLGEDGTLLLNALLSGIVWPTTVIIELRGYSLGQSVCSPGIQNSTGAAGALGAGGSAFAGGRPLWLRATDLPQQQACYFLASRTPRLVPGVGGSQGTLCIGGSIGRFAAQLGNTGALGLHEIDVDTSAIPAGPTVQILSGETWIFQAWYRDANPGPTSNFTDALAITFE